jgi:predicted dehydrogenase
MNSGVIGYGYWGPNIARNLSSLERAKVHAIADLSAAARARMRKAHPAAIITADPRDVLSSAVIDTVAIVSPLWAHNELAKAAN